MSELKKINGPLNIVGELEATSLDVNGAADISGAVVIGSTLDVAGHIQLTDGAQRNIIGALNQNLGIYANPNGANEGIKFSTDEGSTIEMIILNGGNVGVGTATPGYKLDVSGNVNISGTGGYLRFNSGDVAVKNEGSYKLGFQTYNSTSSSLTTKMVLDTNGNVGIGTVTPGSKLQIYSAATRDIFISGHGTQAQNDWQAEHAFFSSAGQGVMVGKANANNNTNRLHILYNNSSGDAQYLGYNTSNVLKVKLDTNGDSFLNGGGLTVGGKITGTELEGTSLDINGNADITGNLAVNSGGIGLTQGYGVNFGVSGYDIVMPSTTTIVMKTGAENAILATVNAGVKLYFNNVVKLETVTGGANVTGTLTATADVIAYSDERLKENVQTLDGKKVLEMRGVSFDRLDDGKSSSGVIAQELEKVAPELVVDDGDYKGVAYGNLVGYLIEAVKDQQKQIDELKAMINGNS